MTRRQGRRPDAQPDRGLALLDRPVHRARRRHRAHGRRAAALAHRGPGAGRELHLVDASRRDHGARRRQPRCHLRRRGQPARLRRGQPERHLRLVAGRAGECPPGPGDPLYRAVGGHQHLLAPVERPRGADRDPAAPRLGHRARRPRRRHRRLDDEPRRGVGLPQPRAVARACRHDGSDRGDRRDRRRPELGRRPRELRCPAGDAAHHAGCHHRPHRCGLPLAGPSLPALGPRVPA